MKITIFLKTQRTCILLLLGVVVLGCSESKEERLQKFLDKGNESYRQANGDQAIYYFEQALNLDSCYTHALNNIGAVHFKAQRLDEAVTFYTKAINCDPAPSSYFNRANTHLQARRYDKALEDIDMVLRMKPDSSIAHFLRGLILSGSNRHDQAIASFERALVDSVLSFDAMVNIASVKIQAHRFEEAEQDLKRCLQARSNEPAVYNSLSLIETERGDFDQALAYVNKALSLDPNHPFFLNNRGYIFLRRDELDKALADIDRSLILDPYNGWAYRNKGIYHFMKSDHTQARRLLEQALSIDPYIDLVHLYLGMTYIELGVKDQGCEQLAESARQGDDIPQPYRHQCPSLR